MRPTLVEFGEVIQYAFRNRNQEFLLKLFAASWVVKGFVPFGAREIVDSFKVRFIQVKRRYTLNGKTQMTNLRLAARARSRSLWF